MRTALFDTRPVQMNVRMDRQLKEAGDAVLSRMGMTPSQVVRSLWEYLVVQGKAPDGIETADIGGELANARRDRVLRGSEIVKGFYRRANIAIPNTDDLPTSDELYASAMEEKYRDWIYE